MDMCVFEGNWTHVISEFLAGIEISVHLKELIH